MHASQLKRHKLDSGLGPVGHVSLVSAAQLRREPLALHLALRENEYSSTLKTGGSTASTCSPGIGKNKWQRSRC